MSEAQYLELERRTVPVAVALHRAPLSAGPLPTSCLSTPGGSSLGAHFKGPFPGVFLQIAEVYREAEEALEWLQRTRSAGTKTDTTRFCTGPTNSWGTGKLTERIQDWKGLIPHGEYFAGLREAHKRKRAFGANTGSGEFPNNAVGPLCGSDGPLARGAIAGKDGVHRRGGRSALWGGSRHPVLPRLAGQDIPRGGA